MRTVRAALLMVLVASATVTTASADQAEPTVAVTVASRERCDPFPATGCVAVATGDSASVSLDATMTSPLDGSAPGGGTADAETSMLIAISHEGASRVALSFDLQIDHAEVRDDSPWAGSGLEGQGSVVLHINARQAGGCCAGTVHTRPIVRSERLAGTWSAPESLSNSKTTLGADVIGLGIDVPPGVAYVELRFVAHVELRNSIAGPALGDYAATLRAGVSNVIVSLTN